MPKQKASRYKKKEIQWSDTGHRMDEFRPASHTLIHQQLTGHQLETAAHRYLQIDKYLKTNLITVNPLEIVKLVELSVINETAEPPHQWDDIATVTQRLIEQTQGVAA